MLTLMLAFFILYVDSSTFIDRTHSMRLKFPGRRVTCTDLNVSDAYASAINVQHCRDLQAGSGQIIISPNNNDSINAYPSPNDPPTYLPACVVSECAVRPIYRVRITGPQIFNTALRIDERKMTIAEYNVQTPGIYHAEVLQLYANFSFCDRPQLNSALTVAKHEWHMYKATSKKISDQACPPGLVGASSGYWIANTSVPSIVDMMIELRDTYVFDRGVKHDKTAAIVKSVLPANDMRWQPSQHCTVDPAKSHVKRIWSMTCRGRAGLICFAGDSQMRHLHLMANTILGRQNVSTNGTNKHIVASDWSRYIHLTFGKELGDADLSNCSRLALNIGQWPIGWPAGDAPWTAHAFLLRLEEMLQNIFLKWPHLKMSTSWISTHPVGILMSRMGTTATLHRDWRTDPYIMQQNSVARQHLRKRHPFVEYIDTFEILFPVSDLSYDGAHYLGTPGYWATAVVLNSLCQ